MSGIINEFLRKAFTRAQSGCQTLTVVMGNEAGDMDSVVGSIYLAFLLDRCTNFGLANIVPALNFPLSELPLRNDVNKLLSEVGVEISSLLSVCRDTKDPDRHFIDMKQIQPSVVLYDHNKLKGDQSFLASNVVGIVDHHFDEEKYLSTSSKLRKVSVVGSACTLVAEMYKRTETPVPFPMLLLAPIILDTVNFDPSQKKVTPEDIAAFEWLRDLEEHKTDFAALFAKVSHWKEDIFGLSVEQNLVRDYKQFQFKCFLRSDDPRIGIASVPCSFAEFAKAYTVDAMAGSCQHLLTEKHLDTVIIAFVGSSGLHSRQVAFFAGKDIIQLFVDYASSQPGEIHFSEIVTRSYNSEFCFIAYSLSDASVSRKRLVPSLQLFLEHGKTSSL